MGFVPFLAKQDRSSGVLKEFEVWFLLYEHEFELRPIIFEVVYYSLYLDLAQPYYGKKNRDSNLKKSATTRYKYYIR